MPLPIIVDIKSEDDSDDGDAFDTVEPRIEVIESLKLEIDDSHHSFEEQQSDSPIQPVEQVYFEEKVNLEVLQANSKNENQGNRTKLLKKSQRTVRKRKQPTEEKIANQIGTKAKKAKIQKEAANRENKREKEKKPSTSSPALKPVECNLCKFTCKRPSHLKRHMLMHTGEKPNRKSYSHTFNCFY